MPKRQFGFAFLLFVPYLAYWGYDYWLKWYRKYYREVQASKTESEINGKADEDDEAATHSPVEAFSRSFTPSLDTPDTAASPSVAATPTLDDYHRVISRVTEGQQLCAADCFVLIHMLRGKDVDQVCDGLRLLETVSVKSSALTKKALLDSGIGKEMQRLLRAQKSLDVSTQTMRQILIIINNLSLSNEGQIHFQAVSTDLLDIAFTSDDESRSVMALQCLTNLTVTPSGNMNFAKAIYNLYRLMDSQPSKVVYILRILINLSTDSQLVPYLLAAQRPDKSMVMLSGLEDVANRWLRFLVNIADAVLSLKIIETDLPITYKASSPDTLYAFLYGHSCHQALADTLLSHQKTGNTAGMEERHQLANRLYKSINLKLIMESSAP